LASHGGGIGLVIALLLYTRKYKIPFMTILDAIAIVLPLGGTFIRLANLMNSEIIECLLMCHGLSFSDRWMIFRDIRPSFMKRFPT
jgi:prolipoprotein diacylglyceryltransferase